MSSNLPLVSVVIPTYNRGHIIGRAIKTVLNQTYQNFEIIVVDDASPDNTQEVVKGFNDARIRYIRHPINRGLSASRNTAIRSAQGAYITLLDDDDEWFPEKLKKQVDKFQSSKGTVGVISCGHKVISDSTGKIVRERIPTHRGNVYNFALKGGFVGLGTVALIKKECFQKVGLFDERLVTAEDWDMRVRISKYFEYDFVPEVLALTHFHDQRISTVPEGKIKAREIILQKYRDEFLKDPSLISDHLNRLGFLCSLSENSLKAKEYFLQSMKRKPVQLFAYRYFLISFLPAKIRSVILAKGVYKIDGIPIYW